MRVKTFGFLLDVTKISTANQEVLDEQTDNTLWHILSEKKIKSRRRHPFTPAMLSWLEPVVLFLLLAAQYVVSDTKDHLSLGNIVVPDETGSDVVDTVVNIIRKNGIFPDHQFFLRHLAMVESADGRDIKNQTSNKYQGGIWKVDNDKFEQTKSVRALLTSTKKQIKKTLNIKWEEVSSSDLRKPLYSGLAAALYVLLKIDKKEIPSGIPEQASLWKTIYRPDAQSSIFLEKVSKLGKLTNLCTKRAVIEQRIFPHPWDRKKYVTCNAVRMYSIKNCQVGKHFSDIQHICMQYNCEIPVWVNQKENVALDKSYPNPCTPDDNRVCNLIFVSHLFDQTKFIQCDKMGHAIVKTCPIDWIWNNQIKTCVYKHKNLTTMQTCAMPNWDNPNEVGMPLPGFYVNPCKFDQSRYCEYVYVSNLMDVHKFIRCDRLGGALIKTCPTSSNWNAALNQCGSVAIITTQRPQCPLPVWDDLNEVGTILPAFYPNPCTADQTRTCEYIYIKYLIDNHKFLRCDRLGQALVKSCPSSSNWNAALNQCGPVAIITTPRPQCPIPVWDNLNEVGTALPAYYQNPCTADQTRNCEYIYKKYLIDNHKFIKCNRLGQALIKSCPTSSNWNSALNQCEPVAIITTQRPQCPRPGWDNLNEIGTILPAFYVNPCPADTTRNCEYIYMKYLIDNHKFIRCDRFGQALVKNCPTMSSWDTVLNQCEPVAIITTQRPQCPIPVWDNIHEVGTILPKYYVNPCTVDQARTCEYIYKKYLIDHHKFIRCNRLGQALIKSCPTSSNWNSALNQCVPVAIITTPRPQCPIPIWDNLNEIGISLPAYYQNPCTADQTRTCEYIYKKYLIDNHKFIRCNRLGQALIKSCPTSSNWNSALNQCVPVAIITTPRPQCPIPIWDNLNEVGISLPAYYQNPCTADQTRTCEYIYKKYLIDNHKFIRCNRFGQALIKSCPTSSNWNSALNQCVPVAIITTPRPQCPIPIWDNLNEVGISLPAYYQNPCTADQTRNCEYIYKKYLIDNRKFIKCNRLGQALIKSCPTSSNWNSALNQCGQVVIITTQRPQCPIPVWDNIADVGAFLPDFYPNPCTADQTRTCEYIYIKYLINNHKFIRCDRLGQALIKTCPTSSNWNSELNQCGPVAIITTPRPQCPIPVWDNQNEVGASLPDFYPNPCTADQTRTCEYIYMKYLIDNHKFVRCDRLGQSLVKSCPTSSNWNAKLNQCGPVSIITTAKPVITTPKPQCIHPVWDNLNEVGTALPSFYPNPCTADQTRTCEYIYIKYLIDNHKFIRCDRLGQALIKSCPTLSNWNAALNQCGPVAIITTPRPQCPIPNWDILNEVGTTLPSYYPNPCSKDFSRQCQFIYLEFTINDHKFIKCDRNGNAIVKTCPSSSIWNSSKKQCY